MKQHLRDPKHLDVIESYVSSTRPMTACLFSVMWKLLLDWLRVQQENNAAESLLKNYLSYDSVGLCAPAGVAAQAESFPVNAQEVKVKSHGIAIGYVRKCQGCASDSRKLWVS